MSTTLGHRIIPPRWRRPVTLLRRVANGVEDAGVPTNFLHAIKNPIEAVGTLPSYNDYKMAAWTQNTGSSGL